MLSGCNINNLIKYPEPDVLIAFSDANLFNFNAKKNFYGHIVFKTLKNLFGRSNYFIILNINQY